MSQEKLDHVVAGAIFDFMGWLTTRQEKLVLSSTDDQEEAHCSACNGTGEGQFDSQSCPVCRGRGY